MTDQDIVQNAIKYLLENSRWFDEDKIGQTLCNARIVLDEVLRLQKENEELRYEIEDWVEYFPDVDIMPKSTKERLGLNDSR